MPNIVTFDSVNLRIVEIDAAGDNVLNAQEIYSEWKDWLLADPQRQGLPPAFSIVSDSDVRPGQTSVPYFFMRTDLGWKLRLAESSHKLTIIGNMLAFGGVGSIQVPTLGAFNTQLETEISPQVLVINSGSGLSAAEQTQLREMYKRLALDVTDPYTEELLGGHTDSGDIDIVNSGDGETSIKGTRQP